MHVLLYHEHNSEMHDGINPLQESTDDGNQWNRRAHHQVSLNNNKKKLQHKNHKWCWSFYLIVYNWILWIQCNSVGTFKTQVVFFIRNAKGTKIPISHTLKNNLSIYFAYYFTASFLYESLINIIGI